MPDSEVHADLRAGRLGEALEKLEELLVGRKRAFLLGAGCSKVAGLPLTTELTASVLGADVVSDDTRAILAEIQASFEGQDGAAGIEDYLSELVDHAAIADRRKLRRADKNQVRLGEREYDSGALHVAITEIKRGITGSIGDADVSVETHRRFVRALHRPFRPGRSLSGQAVDYLVLNYDTVLEDALALERVPFADGMEGGATGWWSPDTTFDRDGLEARVLKLHGSIDWFEFEDDPLPRRLNSKLTGSDGAARNVLIWPASTKYRETQIDPYAQLAARVRSVLSPRDGENRLLVVCGYRFADEHINREIDRALRQSDDRLTMVAFTSDDQPEGPLQSWHQDPDLAAQVLVFANRGFFHADEAYTSETDLPWWRFEQLTAILGGER